MVIEEAEEVVLVQEVKDLNQEGVVIEVDSEVVEGEETEGVEEALEAEEVVQEAEDQDLEWE